MPKKWNIQDFIKAARLVHGDYFDYQKSQYVNYDTPVEIICPVHGPFWQKPLYHLSKSKPHGCRNCTMKKNHGDTHPGHRPDAKKRRAETNTRRYGAAHHMSGNSSLASIVRDKRKSTFAERYGVEHPMQHPDVKTKTKAAWNAKSADDIALINEKRKSTWRRLYGVENPFGLPETIARIKSSHVVNGRWVDDADKPEYKLYKQKVWRLTEKSYKETEALINPNKFPRGKMYHLDHRISIAEGFRRGVDAEIISHPANLTIIEAKKNQRKGIRSSTTLDDLTQAIQMWPSSSLR